MAGGSQSTLLSAGWVDSKNPLFLIGEEGTESEGSRSTAGWCGGSGGSSPVGIRVEMGWRTGRSVEIVHIKIWALLGEDDSSCTVWLKNIAPNF